MSTSKPVKYSVALVIYNDDRTKYLIVQRPLNDESLPGSWGFPATSKKHPEESWDDAVRRAAKIKLGIDVEIIKLLGEEETDRGNYILKLRDYEVKIKSGEISVPQSDTGTTQYIRFKYTNEPNELAKSAQKGSLCSRIFLRANNINWE